MPLPPTVRVKLSSEAAESISITPVVVREIPIRELVDHMLGVIGKDKARVHELLLRGTLVSGASRFRWAGWDAPRDAIEEMLASFPDPDPARPFWPQRCERAVLRCGTRRIELPREAGARKPLLRRTSFWDLLMEASVTTVPRYVDYSYRERADCYTAAFPLAEAKKLRDGAGLLRYTTIEQQIRRTGVDAAELFVARE